LKGHRINHCLVRPLDVPSITNSHVFQRDLRL